MSKPIFLILAMIVKVVNPDILASPENMIRIASFATIPDRSGVVTSTAQARQEIKTVGDLTTVKADLVAVILALVIVDVLKIVVDLAPVTERDHTKALAIVHPLQEPRPLHHPLIPP